MASLPMENADCNSGNCKKPSAGQGYSSSILHFQDSHPWVLDQQLSLGIPCIATVLEDVPMIVPFVVFILKKMFLPLPRYILRLVECRL